MTEQLIIKRESLLPGYYWVRREATMTWEIMQLTSDLDWYMIGNEFAYEGYWPYEVVTPQLEYPFIP